jgi:flagellar biosynthesis/type III secretory pathway M-ring protein FliF/YscJ
MFYIILYTLLIIFLIHFILYYMNIDIIQLYTHERVEETDTIIDELESSLNLLKEMNKNYT